MSVSGSRHVVGEDGVNRLLGRHVTGVQPLGDVGTEDNVGVDEVEPVVQVVLGDQCARGVAQDVTVAASSPAGHGGPVDQKS